MTEGPGASGPSLSRLIVECWAIAVGVGAGIVAALSAAGDATYADLPTRLVYGFGYSAAFGAIPALAGVLGFAALHAWTGRVPALAAGAVGFGIGALLLSVLAPGSRWPLAGLIGAAAALVASLHARRRLRRAGLLRPTEENP